MGCSSSTSLQSNDIEKIRNNSISNISKNDNIDNNIEKKDNEIMNEKKEKDELNQTNKSNKEKQNILNDDNEFKEYTFPSKIPGMVGPSNDGNVIFPFHSGNKPENKTIPINFINKNKQSDSDSD